MQVVLAQPGTALPQSAVISAQIQAIKLTTATNAPNPVMRRRGLTERLVMPSMASASIFLRG